MSRGGQRGRGKGRSAKETRGKGVAHSSKEISKRGSSSGQEKRGSRGGSRGRGRGGRGSNNGRGGRGARYTSPPPVPLIIPNVPPLYPPAGARLKALSNVYKHLTPWYNRCSQYFRSNYSVKLEKKNPSSFHVEKYTDRYAEPLKMEEYLQYKLDPEFICAELSAVGLKKVRKKEMTDSEVTRKLELRSLREKANNEENMSDDEKNESEDKKENPDDEAAPKNREDDDDEEEQEDPDEELDEGTDYLANYFDNGEGYLHSDDDMDDSNVY